jgi:hypothetical protein
MKIERDGVSTKSHLALTPIPERCGKSQQSIQSIHKYAPAREIRAEAGDFAWKLSERRVYWLLGQHNLVQCCVAARWEARRRCPAGDEVFNRWASSQSGRLPKSAHRVIISAMQNLFAVGALRTWQTCRRLDPSRMTRFGNLALAGWQPVML